MHITPTHVAILRTASASPGAYTQSLWESCKQVIEFVNCKQVKIFLPLFLQRMNLTAVTERAAVMDRHIGDSLTLLPVIEHALVDTAELRGSQIKSETFLMDLGTDSTNKPDCAESTITESVKQSKSSSDVQKKRPRKKSKQGAAGPQTDASELETVFDATGGVKRLRVVDVGTGAGLPGLVFAIARPKWDLILIESLRKRCTFLEHVVLEVSHRNVCLYEVPTIRAAVRGVITSVSVSRAPCFSK
jgi:16S rRNA G527 N7-methylase RsmG